MTEIPREVPRDSTEISRMSVHEFRHLGFLQEVNRQLLHPCGLALEVIVDAGGNERFGEIWDYRDDPEGILFLQAPDAEKAARVAEEADCHAAFRQAMLEGHVIQPIGVPAPSDVVDPT